MTNDIETLNNLIMKTEVLNKLFGKKEYEEIFVYLENKVKNINDYLKCQHFKIIKQAINEILNNQKFITKISEDTSFSIQDILSI